MFKSDTSRTQYWTVFFLHRFSIPHIQDWKALSFHSPLYVASWALLLLCLIKIRLARTYFSESTCSLCRCDTLYWASLLLFWKHQTQSRAEAKSTELLFTPRHCVISWLFKTLFQDAEPKRPRLSTSWEWTDSTTCY